MIGFPPRLRIVPLAAALIAASLSPARAQTPSIVTPDRLLADYSSPLQSVPQLSWTPDGSTLVFAAEAKRLGACERAKEAGADGRDVWIASLDVRTGTCRLIVRGRRPLVSPDGARLAYVAGMDAESRIATIGVDASMPQDVTQKSTGIGEYFSGFAWSPDGSRIAYGFRPEWKKGAAGTGAKSTVRVIGGAGDLPPDSEIWIATPGGGEPRKVHQQPALFTDLAWFPDGQSVMFVARGSFDYRTDGFTAEVRAIDPSSGAVRTLVKDAGVQGLNPVLSRDGRQIAFHYDPGNLYYPSYYRLATVPATGGTIRPLTDKLYLRHSPRWAPDNATIFFGGKPGALSQIFAVESGRPPRQITKGSREVHNFALSPDGRTLAWVALDPYGRMEIRSAHRDGAGERVILDFTPEIATLTLGEAAEVRWKSTDGLEIVGVLVKPVGYQAGRRYPLIVDLHGGPLGGVSLAGRVLLTSPLEWQMWAAKGYAVLHADYRSSAIYGWDPVLAMRERQDEAERDFDDIMSGVDHVIQAGLADPDRLGVIGHSAGAFRTNWIVTHTSRFKVAVSYEGVADMFLAYGTGARVGGNVALEWHYKGKPWDVPQHYRKGSPLEFVKNVKTPTMFVSGSQGIALFHNEAMYSAWKVQGVPVEFLVYDGEGHVISKPDNQRDLLTRVIAWVDRWLK